MISVVAVLAFLAGFGLRGCGDDKCSSAVKVKREVNRDTVPYHKPNPTEERALGSALVRVPVSIGNTESGPSALYSSPLGGRIVGLASGSFVETTDTALGVCCQDIPAGCVGPHDSVTVEIPIVQREFESSDYHAWVSGYDPKLDSIMVYPKHEVVTVMESRECKRRRWGVGIFAGYGMTPQGLQPCVGVSVNYNILQF